MFKALALLLLAFFLGRTALTLEVRKPQPAPFNDLILEIVHQMPKGGGYETSPAAFRSLKDAVKIQDGKLQVTVQESKPSFCSAATYLVFTKVVAELQKQKKLTLDEEAAKALLIHNEADGSGVWGRWNANGPGTARLFYQLELGANFTDVIDAKPGDFMKAFWTDEIGVRERGHSVIFTGLKHPKEGREICFWSSNSSTPTAPAGLGEKCLAESKFHHLVFSRLQSPENLRLIGKKISAKNYSDKYLASMLKRASSMTELCEQVGCAKNTLEAPRANP